MNGLSERPEALREKIIGLGEKSIRKSYYPELQKRIRELEEAKALVERKNAELESYLYVASHDLRSPLVNIQGFSARFGKQAEEIKALLALMAVEGENLRLREEALGILSEKVPRSLEFIRANSEKMDRLLNGLLRVSRTGRMVLTVRPLDMDALVASVVRGLSYEIEESGARVTVGTLPPCAGDEELLSQAFANLIGNALKYRSPDRPPEITVTGVRSLDRCSYTVRDNGIGIAERHLERVWDVFYRVAGSGVTGGEGLGLSIVKRIADKHRGSVSLESREGEGSAFTLTIPAEETAHE